VNADHARAMKFAALPVVFVELTAPTGQMIIINPAEVSSLVEPAQVGRERHFVQGTRCVVVMSNSRINAVAEPCKAVEEMMEEAKEGAGQPGH